jgi:periplasmic protein CpxP/Spy
MQIRLFSAVTLAAALVWIGTAVAAEPTGKTAPRDPQAVLNQMRLKKMTQELSLTEEQQVKVRALLEAEAAKMSAVQNNSALSYSDRVAEQNAIKKESGAKLQALLTDEQKQKVEALAAKNSKKKKTPSAEKPAAPTDKPEEPGKAK